jgi:hypothetical protein
MNRCRRFAFAVVAAALWGAAAADIRVSWERPVTLGRGAYARVHRLADGRLMAVYERGGLWVQFASAADPCTWGRPRRVARDFTASNGVERIRVSLANAEFAQLANGRLVYACNLRPAKGRHDVHPFSIGILTSDDGGATWSPLRVLHRATVALPPGMHGCYEPFVLPGTGGHAQIYYADESPYVTAGCRYQEISVIETADGGATWSRPRTVCYTPARRDGMPVVLELGDWRFLAIEANPGRTRLHPQIVRNHVSDNWRVAVRAPSADRLDPLADAPDWRRVCGGAPYLVATENFILLSWQEKDQHAPPFARVAAVPKTEVTDGRLTGMRGVSTPPDVVPGRTEMLWNALCPLEGDRFLLVSQTDGRIVVRPGRVGLSTWKETGKETE